MSPKAEDEVARPIGRALRTSIRPEEDPDQVAKSEENEARGKPEQDTLEVQLTLELQSKQANGETKWGPPQFREQFVRRPETARIGASTAAFFKVPEELEALNRLLSRQSPEEAPTLILQSRKEEFQDGRFYVLVYYRPIDYIQLVPQKEQK